MANTPCLVRNIKLVTVFNGSKYFGDIDSEGMELTNVQLTVTDEPNRRTYVCSNCNMNFEGSETFDEVKAHFGTVPA